MRTESFVQQTEAAQKRVQAFAFVIALCVAVCFSIGIAGFGYLSSGRCCEAELESQISPNQAPIASLVRLPGIGPSRAAAIVAYREKFGGEDGESKVFRNCEDLQKVKGIGPKTAGNISKWLQVE